MKGIEISSESLGVAALQRFFQDYNGGLSTRLVAQDVKTFDDLCRDSGMLREVRGSVTTQRISVRLDWRMQLRENLITSTTNYSRPEAH